MYLTLTVRASNKQYWNSSAKAEVELEFELPDSMSEDAPEMVSPMLIALVKQVVYKYHNPEDEE